MRIPSIEEVVMKYDPPNMFVAVCNCCGAQAAPTITRGAALVMWDERREPGDTKAFCELADRLAGKSTEAAQDAHDDTTKAEWKKFYQQ